MKRIVWVVAVLAACKKKEAATPPPPPPSVVVDAAPVVVVDAAAPVVVDAPAPKLAITHDGIGPLQRLAWAKIPEDDVRKKIQDALSPLMPGITTSFDVMDVPGEVEREEGYWSVKRGDKELVQIVRTGGDERPAVMFVWTPDIPTEDGIKVGDTVATVLEKHPKLACANHPGSLVEETVPVDAKCEDTNAPGLFYVLSVKKKLKKGTLDPSTIKDTSIVGLIAIPK